MKTIQEAFAKLSLRLLELDQVAYIDPGPHQVERADEVCYELTCTVFSFQKKEIKSTTASFIKQFTEKKTIHINKFSAADQRYFVEEMDWYINRMNEILRRIELSDKIELNDKVDAAKTKGFNLSNTDIEAIKKILEALNLRLPLFNPKSSIDDFIKIISAPSFSENKATVRLAIENTQFRYIIQRLSTRYEQLTIEAIGNSKAFISKQNNVITAHNLNNSKVHNPKEQGTIDEVLKKFP